MTPADLADITTLQLGGARGPAGWIDWNRTNYAEHGFGLWVLETEAGGFVGDCGLTVQDVAGEPMVEVGWHVRADLQGCGFATEAARSVVAAAKHADIDHLVAIIRPDNLASQRVAEKIGFVVERRIVKNGEPALVYGADLR